MDRVSIIATVTARPETRQELRALLAAQVAPTRGEAGCLRYDLYADPADPCAFVFHEEWRAQSDLDAHMGTPHIAPLLGQADRLLARPIEVRHLEGPIADA
jgi:quinol monooxygenase YgiN